MILDFIAVLTSDATLQTTLRAAGSNKKVYPIVAPDGETSPWIVYNFSTQGTNEDVIDEALIHLNIYAESYTDAYSILERVITLLDIYEGAKHAITSASYQFLFSKMVPGGSDTQEEDTRLYHLTRTFLVKYKRRTGG